MDKIEGNLLKGEKVLAKAENSSVALIVVAVINVLLLLAWPLAILYFLIFTLPAITSYLTTNLCITNKRVYGTSGLIKKQDLDMPLKSVNAISTSKTFFGSILGYASLSITSYGEGWTFKRVKNANDIRKIFYEAQEDTEKEKK